MPKLICRLFLMSVVCAGATFGQSVAGTFAQIAFGGSWQTTFTLINVSTDVAGVTLNFFGDNGAPLNAPVTVPGSPNISSTNSYTFTIPASSSQTIVLPSTDPTTTTQGWASMTVSSGRVQGQGSFRALLPSGSTFEAVVPLTTSGSTVCIIPFPPTGTPVILIPFDNTGGYNSSIAIANISSSAAQSIPIEFDDETNHQLKTDVITLQANGHTAFTLATKYPQDLAGKRGIIRLTPQFTSSVSVLGLLSNPSNAITTIIPIIP